MLGPYFVFYLSYTMSNKDLFDYLVISLKNVENSYENYCDTNDIWWRSLLRDDVLKYHELLKQAKQQMPKEAMCFPELVICKNGSQITVYTVLFKIVM